jgi:hypothetical protein
MRNKQSKRKPKLAHSLKGWQDIAKFLGQPVSVVQRWAKHSGLPVSRQDRNVVASRDELNSSLGRESGEPVHVATEQTDLSAELKRGLYVRKEKRAGAKRRR